MAANNRFFESLRPSHNKPSALVSPRALRSKRPTPARAPYRHSKISGDVPPARRPDPSPRPTRRAPQTHRPPHRSPPPSASPPQRRPSARRTAPSPSASPSRSPRQHTSPYRNTGSPRKEYANRMEAWSPQLPFPFRDDLNQYDPVLSERIVAFDRQRSDDALQRYLTIISSIEENRERRRREREETVKQTLEREAEREIVALREQQDEVVMQLQLEAMKEERLQRAMEREVERVESLVQKRAYIRQREQELDEEYDDLLNLLRDTERETEKIITRQSQRAEARRQVLSQIEATEETYHEITSLAVREELAREQWVRAGLEELAADHRSQVAANAAFELGKEMRMRSITTVQQAQEAGLMPCYALLSHHLSPSYERQL